MHLLDKLAALNASIESRDTALRTELQDKRRDAAREPETVRGLDAAPRDRGFFDGVGGPRLAEETIVLRTGRPVLAIVHDEAQLTFSDPDSEVWRDRLKQVSTALMDAARAVGRIEVVGHRMSWLGTGWLVAPDIIVTNRHVAAEFGRADCTRFVFRQGLAGQPMSASIDFVEEFGNTEERTFAVQRIVHIEDDGGPDMAFLQVASRAATWPTPIALGDEPVADDLVAVIGYPARDSRIPDQALMEQIFGNVYDKKRLAPGQLTGVRGPQITHDCSTLGGNSGSVVFSLRNGQAVGLHYAGRFMEANFAVSGVTVCDRLREVTTGSRTNRPTVGFSDPATQLAPAKPALARFTTTIPLKVTVELGESYAVDVSPASAPVADLDEVITEGVPADYADRRGYDETFLGSAPAVPLPEVQDTADVLTFPDTADNIEKVLRYEHFSVVMSSSRRMCRFSAVNIDGKQRAKVERSGWRTDPRIPAKAQIIKECYGNAPKFSRGHMTRREDPVWGTPTSAELGNDDSMHVTNVVPQMQTFNAGIWLDLENYALFHARRDDMRISVFTGPFLTDQDPEMFGVRIPIEFWKVIVFVHDDTNALTATGYSLSQHEFVSENEFVFGEHKTAQRRISWIEQKAGLSFGQLAGLDPFREPEGVESELTDVRDIQFV